MTAFVDTFAFIAWYDARDAAHRVVMDYLTRYQGSFVTTEWVLLEVADGFSHPAFRTTVAGALRELRTDPLFEVVPYDPAVFQNGFDLYAARPDKHWSLTDCISFTVMSERGLTDALTADRHYRQAGFHPTFAASAP